MTTINLQLPDMYPRQREALMHPARYVFIEGSTKSGKTAGCMTWQMAQVLSRRPGVHWWVAPIYSQAKIAFKRILKDYDGTGIFARVDNSGLSIDFVNGATWSFKSADNDDALYGEELQSAVIDEASRCKEGTWAAVRSTTTTTQAPIRAIGNVRGRKNWHYVQCRKAEAGEPGYHYAKLTAQDAVDGGILDPSELEQAQRDLSHEVYRELYFCEPSEEAYNPFGYAAIDACTADGLSRHPPVVYGLDLARKADWTVLVGLDQYGHVSRFWRHQGGTWNELVDAIVGQVGDVPVHVDATGVGDVVVEQLRMRGVNVRPFVFTASSKQDLMQSLRIALAESRIKYPDGPIRSELECFEYSMGAGGRVSYSAPSGMHDDCVCALALAWYLGGVLTSLVTSRMIHGIEPVIIAAPRPYGAGRYR